jgi:hypothetical protein
MRNNPEDEGEEMLAVVIKTEPVAVQELATAQSAPSDVANAVREAARKRKRDAEATIVGAGAGASQNPKP